MISIQDVPFYDLERLRIERLAALPVFQELYLEFLATGKLGPIRTVLMSDEEEILGYAIVGQNDTLLECYFKAEATVSARDCFERLIKDLQIKIVLCQSFDEPLLRLCRQGGYPHRPIGRLYRDQEPAADYPLNDLMARLAEPSDLPLLLSQEDEVFEPKEMMAQEIAKGGIVLFMKDGKLAGCGFMTRIHPAFDSFDLGIWTHPAFRRQGVARRMVHHLKTRLHEAGAQLSCGCDVNNLASQKTLASNGFISRHALLEFKVGT